MGIFYKQFSPLRYRTFTSLKEKPDQVSFYTPNLRHSREGGWSGFIEFQFVGGGGGVYMREIGTMWQIGVLTAKPCTFLGPKWVIFGVLALQK